MGGEAMSGIHADLKADFHVFEAHREEWLRLHEGEFVLIHKQSFAGFFTEYSAALRAGMEQFGVKSEFLIQQVCVEEPVFVIY